jgi:hypothetical protein
VKRGLTGNSQIPLLQTMNAGRMCEKSRENVTITPQILTVGQWKGMMKLKVAPRRMLI